MADELSAADFKDLTGQVLSARLLVDEPVDVPLTLVKVAEREAHDPAFRAPFTLELTGPPAPVLAQGTYALTHPTRGPLQLFLVPHAAGPERAEYSIDFS